MSKGHSLKPSIRTCIVCRAKAEKAELVRFCISNQVLVIDRDMKSGGRGAYAHEACLADPSRINPGRWAYALRILGTRKKVRRKVLKRSKPDVTPAGESKSVEVAGDWCQVLYEIAVSR